MAISRKDFVPTEGELTLDGGRQTLVIGGRGNGSLTPIVAPGRGGTYPDTSRTPGERGDVIDGHDPDAPHWQDTPDDDINPPSKDTIDPDERNADRDVDNILGTNTGITPFVPDATLSPEENLRNIQDWISHLFSSYALSGGMVDGTVFTNILTDAYNAVWRLSSSVGLDSKARLTLAEKVSDLSWNLLTMQFDQALQYQSWYLQQEYNSPVNQATRLADAGLSCAFALGSYSAGNAQSAAGVASAQPAQASGAGEQAAQSQQHDMDMFSSLLSTAVSVIPGVGGVAASLISAFASKKLSTAQAQYAGSQIVNDITNRERVQEEINSMKQSSVIQQFDTLSGIWNSSVEGARNDVQTQQSVYDSLYEKLPEIEEEAYEVQATTKGGQNKTYTLTNNEVSQAIENGGKLSDGSTIVGSESWGKSTTADVKASAGLSFPGASFGVSGGLSHTNSSGGSKSNSQSRSAEASHSESDSSKSSESGYAENGSSFTIGNTKFTRVTTRRRVATGEAKEMLDAQLKRIQSSCDRWNALRTGQRAALLCLMKDLENNFSGFSKSVVHNTLMAKFMKAFDGEVSYLTGD